MGLQNDTTGTGVGGEFPVLLFDGVTLTGTPQWSDWVLTHDNTVLQCFFDWTPASELTLYIIKVGYFRDQLWPGHELLSEYYVHEVASSAGSNPLAHTTDWARYDIPFPTLTWIGTTWYGTIGIPNDELYPMVKVGLYADNVSGGTIDFAMFGAKKQFYGQFEVN